MQTTVPLLCATILALWFGGSSASVLKECDDAGVKGQENLDMNRVMGTWYDFKRFPHYGVLFGMDCGHSHFNVSAKGEITISHVGRDRGRIFSAFGTAQKNPKDPAELSILFDYDLDNIPADYFIIDTDYDHYLLLIVCNSYADNDQIYAWILTRQRGIVPPNLEGLKSKLGAMGVDIYSFERVSQTNCENVHH